METVRPHLSVYQLKNFFQEFLKLSVFLLLFIFPVHLSATVGEEVKDSASAEIINTEEKEIQKPTDSNAEKPLLYISEGVTVFALHHLNDDIKIKQVAAEKVAAPAKKEKKKSTIAVQAEEQVKKAKKFRTAPVRFFYLTSFSDLQILCSKDFCSGSVSSLTHYFAFQSHATSYPILKLSHPAPQITQYQSATLDTDYFHNFSVRPPPSLS